MASRCPPARRSVHEFLATLGSDRENLAYRFRRATPARERQWRKLTPAAPELIISKPLCNAHARLEPLQTAPLRERVSFRARGATICASGCIRSSAPAILSTCNRTEITVRRASRTTQVAIAGWLDRQNSKARPHSHLYALPNGEAVRRIFRVAAGLPMVPASRRSRPEEAGCVLATRPAHWLAPAGLNPATRSRSPRSTRDRAHVNDGRRRRTAGGAENPRDARAVRGRRDARARGHPLAAQHPKAIVANPTIDRAKLAQRFGAESFGRLNGPTVSTSPLTSPTGSR